MEYLQVTDPWLRRAITEFLGPEPGLFGVQAVDLGIVLDRAEGQFVLSADGHEVETYAQPLRLAALMADLVWFFTQRRERANSEILLTGDYVLYPHAFALAHADMRAALTGREVAMLEFMKKHGECSKEILLSEVWRYHPESDTHTVETHLWRLRQKLQQAGMTAPLVITTDKGYRLA